MTIPFVLIRAIHFVSCLLMLGIWGVDRLVLAPILGETENVVRRSWERFIRTMMGILAPGALASGAAWLACVARNMSGLPWRQALEPRVMSVVWDGTTFGRVWHWRIGCWGVAAALSALAALGRWRGSIRTAVAWGALAASAALAGSLAWAGHGLTGPPGHRAADVLHLAAAGFWPMGLLPLSWLLWIAGRMPAADARRFRWLLVCRFSAMSVAVMLVLVASGLVNGFFLVGSVAGLVSTNYGRLLMVKVLLFLIMAALGAMNLAHWRPRLVGADGTKPDEAARRIRGNVWVELLIAGLIIVIVAVLGLLPPPIHEIVP